MSRRFRALEQLLGLVVHQDDVGAFVGDENRIRDVLEDEVQAVALSGRPLLGLTDPLNLLLQFVGRAAQVGDVAQH